MLQAVLIAVPPRKRQATREPARVAVRQRLGRLSDLRVTARTFNRYVRSAARFLEWAQQAGHGGLAADDAALEHQLCEYIEELWQEGEGRSAATDVMSSVCFLLKRPRSFHAGWRLCSTWARLELPCRAPPLTQDLLLAMCGYACSIGRSDIACGMCLGFHCLLRTGELAGVCVEHVNLSPLRTGVLALPLTKSGQRRGAQEIVTVDDSCVGALVAALMARSRSGKLMPGVTSRTLCDFFRESAEQLGISSLNLRPYSIRRGGATHDFLVHGSVQKTILRGRWSDLKVARIYITDGLAVQSQFAVAAAARERCRHYSRIFALHVQSLAATARPSARAAAAVPLLDAC